MSRYAELPALDSAFALDPAAVESFARHGHVRLSAVATPDEVPPYRDVISGAARRHSAETRPLEERDTYGKAFVQIENLWRVDQGVERFVTARRFAGIAARLLGVQHVRLYHDQALFKEPGGGPTPWHQDSVYWPLDTEDTVTMWMPLVDLAEDMGGMQFASGSHREKELATLGISDEAETHFARLLQDGRHPVTAVQPMQAGDATFHRGWTLHRAQPNRSATVREVMTVIYVADGARVAEPREPWHHSELASWMPGLGPGDPVASALNPLLTGDRSAARSD
ncbi:phytanoyl-CoA dioxygenase family protein [Streptomyces triticagri]|uniref:Phytanoyl-CoA dioxygenase family protein n=1 Tax=Streptomyces triticagri TaxID=2293568 RepID=A0A372M260_9ACTN|nr:phytanoyl-CoA dioxygenase family protein [Streptomyces triticagri]RFU85024.1 phytanoyl-CoA dioxygenase family protein [Streptomyces triticagri]